MSEPLQHLRQKGVRQRPLFQNGNVLLGNADENDSRFRNFPIRLESQDPIVRQQLPGFEVTSLANRQDGERHHCAHNDTGYGG